MWWDPALCIAIDVLPFHGSCSWKNGGDSTEKGCLQSLALYVPLYVIEYAREQMKTNLSNYIKDHTGMSNVYIAEFNCKIQNC